MNHITITHGSKHTIIPGSIIWMRWTGERESAAYTVHFRDGEIFLVDLKDKHGDIRYSSPDEFEKDCANCLTDISPFITYSEDDIPDAEPIFAASEQIMRWLNTKPQLEPMMLANIAILCGWLRGLTYDRERLKEELEAYRGKDNS